MRERRRAKRHADAASRKDGAAAAGAGKSLSEPKRARVEADSAATPKYMPSAPPKGALELLPSVVSSCTTLPPSRAESPPSGEELDEQLMLMVGDDLICVDASVEGPLAHQRASGPAVKLPGQDIGSDWPHYVGLGAMEPALPQYLPEFGYGSGSAPGQVEVGGGEDRPPTLAARRSRVEGALSCASLRLSKRSAAKSLGFDFLLSLYIVSICKYL